MGTTFVTISTENTPEEPGFWMSDAMLELWLRLLALHLPEPGSDGQDSASIPIRNRWLLASRGYFMGCVPHGMEEACGTEAGKAVVRQAVQSLLSALQSMNAPLHAATLNLLGIEGQFTRDIPVESIQDIAHAFLDLIDGKITGVAATAEIMPGSTPYRRADTAGS